MQQFHLHCHMQLTCLICMLWMYRQVKVCKFSLCGKHAVLVALVRKLLHSVGLVAHMRTLMPHTDNHLAYVQLNMSCSMLLFTCTAVCQGLSHLVQVSCVWCQVTRAATVVHAHQTCTVHHVVDLASETEATSCIGFGNLNHLLYCMNRWQTTDTIACTTAHCFGYSKPIPHLQGLVSDFRNQFMDLFHISEAKPF